MNSTTEILTNKAQYECSSCGIDLMIAGAYDKSTQQCQGKSLPSMYQCHNCNTVMLPKKKDTGMSVSSPESNTT